MCKVCASYMYKFCKTDCTRQHGAVRDHKRLISRCIAPILMSPTKDVKAKAKRWVNDFLHGRPEAEDKKVSILILAK